MFVSLMTRTNTVQTKYKNNARIAAFGNFSFKKLNIIDQKVI